MKRECKYCLVEQDITMFQKRSRRTSRIWKCNTCRAAESRSKAETAKAKNRQRAKRQRFLDEHGVALRAVETFAKKVGLPATDPDTIETYKLHVARQKLLSTLRKVAKVIRRRNHKLKMIGRKAENANNGRLTLSQAWADWHRLCPLQWFIDAQVKAPMKRFSTSSEWWKFNYTNIIHFQLNERNRRRIKSRTDGKLFRSIDNAARNAVRYKNSSAAALSEFLGYTPTELRENIESKFKDGMSWQRLSEIHIDHIIPCSHFDMESPDEVVACWAMVNLKPEWAEYNRAKSDKIIASELSTDLVSHIKANAPRVYREHLGVLRSISGHGTSASVARGCSLVFHRPGFSHRH